MDIEKKGTRDQMDADRGAMIKTCQKAHFERANRNTGGSTDDVS